LKEARTGYVVILMAIFWMTEALPICITSLIPIALFPILGVASTGTVVSAYLRENGMLFLGSLMLATSIEYCNLHRRIALRVLLLFGGGARWLATLLITSSIVINDLTPDKINLL